MQSVRHTLYFVLLTVVPTTLLGLGIALMVARLRGWLQSLVLAAFFLPYILPVTVVYLIWQWMLDPQFGIAQYPIRLLLGHPVAMWADPLWAMPRSPSSPSGGPTASTCCCSSRAAEHHQDIYDAAALDGARRWTRSALSPGR